MELRGKRVMAMLASIFTDVIKQEKKLSYRQRKYRIPLHIPFIAFVFLTSSLFSHFPLSLLSCNAFFYFLFISILLLSLYIFFILSIFIYFIPSFFALPFVIPVLVFYSRLLSFLPIYLFLFLFPPS
jgi:hypothetical protein